MRRESISCSPRTSPPSLARPHVRWIACVPLLAGTLVRAQEGSCCLPHQAPSCEHSWCAKQVCAVDPSCCEDAWDAPCVELARTQCPWECPMPHGPVAIDHGILPSAATSPVTVYRTSGDLIAVGRPGAAGTAGPNQGVVEVYTVEASGRMRLDAVIQAPDGQAEDRFGSALDIVNGRLLVGSPFDDWGGKANAGSAHEFVRDPSGQWNLFRTHRAPDATPEARFGNAVAIWYDTISVIGAPYATTAGLPSAGCFYYSFIDQQSPIRVNSPQPGAFDLFGGGITAWKIGSRGLLVVAAPLDDTPATDAGSLRLYSLGGPGPDWPMFSYFGQEPGLALGSVMDSADWVENHPGMLAIGIPNATVDGQANRGAVLIFVFNWSTFVPTWAITLPEGQAGDHFGAAISVGGGRIAVLAPNATVEKQQDLPGAFMLARHYSVGWQVGDWFTEMAVGRARHPDSAGPPLPAMVLREDTLFWDPGGGSGPARLDFFPLDCHGDGTFDVDSDGDGVADCTDLDDDQDGFADHLDGCPLDRFKIRPGCLGCGTAEPDPDADLVPTCEDNCPNVANSAQEDCDGDLIGDACTISEGLDTDWDGNGIPDRCDCLSDLDRDGTVGPIDLAMVLAGFGQPNPGPSDINRDGTVNGLDLGLVLGAWGACP